jgi:hypothetical protein
MNRYKFLKYPSNLIAIIIIIGSVLRLYKINRVLGGHDESAMLLYFGYAPLKYITTTYFDANNHVFHTILVQLMAFWFGDDNSLAIRFPTLLFGLAGLGAIYALALKIFQSKPIAIIALWIAAIHPVHIHYSQTARGYSLIMFFSALIIYSSIKILESDNPMKWSGIFILCGTLSVYTLPTNVYFLAGLAGWILYIAMSRKNICEFSFDPDYSRRIFILTGVLGGLIAALSFLVYFPILGQMIDTAKNHPLLTWDTSTAQVFNLIPTTTSEILKGPLIWFFPIMIVGLIWGETSRNSYKKLPIFIFVLPFLITMLTGVAGYPRNYLYNFPIWIVFLAGGLVSTGNLIGKLWISHGSKNIVPVSLTLALTLTVLHYNFNHYYPSLNTSDGNLFKENIQSFSKPNDLILVADSRNFLYSRTIYKNNFLNIIQDNKLTGIQFISPAGLMLNDYKIPTVKGMDPIFKNVYQQDLLNFQDVSGEKSMVSLATSESLSIFPEDFESNTYWETVQGQGKATPDKNHWITGKSSISLKADLDKDFIIRSSASKKIRVSKPSLVVLTWTKSSPVNGAFVYHPVLGANGMINEQMQTMQIRTGKVNDGIHVQIQDRSNTTDPYYWFANASLGKLPPGEYSFYILLKTKAGKNVLYDSLSLFIVDMVGY